jgi:hypothetical protein
MEDTCNLCNVIEIFSPKKVTKIERRGLFGPFKLQTTLAQLCKDTSAYLCRHPNTSIVKGKN